MLQGAGPSVTTREALHATPAPAAPPARARCSRRIQAVAVDLLVHGTSLTAMMSLLELLHGRQELAGGAFAGWLGFAMLYEPLLVSWRGATLGHSMSGLRVMDRETGRNPGVIRAFARFWLKVTSGPIGLLIMAVFRRSEALHDTAVDTCVGERQPLA